MTDPAHGPVIRDAMASLCDPETPSTYLKGKQKPEPIHSRFILPRKWRGGNEWMGMLIVITRRAPVIVTGPTLGQITSCLYPHIVLRSKNFPLEGEPLRVPVAGVVPLPALCCHRSQDPAHLLELLGFVLVSPLEEVEQDDVT